MTNYLVIGDIHGKLDSFLAMLNQWNPEKEQLVILGDLVDRGTQSRQVIQTAMTLRQEYGAVILKGNHDDMFLHWLSSPEGQYYYSQGGNNTIDSFFGNRMTTTHHPDHLAKILKERFSDEVAFMSSLPNYYDADPFIMVHAGIDTDKIDWKETHPEDFKWIRHDFHHGENKTGRTVLFGHTPTQLLNADQTLDIWVSPCQTKIGLDGGAVFGGFLHALRIIDNEPSAVLTVDKDLQGFLRPYPLVKPVR